MRLRALISASTIALCAQPTLAAIVGECEGSLVSHILQNVDDSAYEKFANGAIRVADLHVDANLASNVVVVVWHPRLSDLQGAGYYQACSVVYSSKTESPYFGQVKLRNAEVDYDPIDGLKLSISTQYHFWNRDSEDGALVLTINQKAGYVEAVEK
ncbi:hypothetical protein [uncultured Litoreibacter sp.]|uniref:hypothetical protein n=1 Tax=uncultured Litoreibacter sp. TaxID=1392394 RepID=UPI002637BFBD|nr:hypothetical protein [uncultured Litoreibacter sp.]